MQFDCARCEELLLDFAYGELDEVTAAAFRRHADGCARCTASLADVRTVREAFSMLPLETPASSLDARILAAADLRLNELDDRKRSRHRRAESRSTFGKMFDGFRALATRPQYATAMVLVLVVGVGLLVIPQLRTSEIPPDVTAVMVGEAPQEAALPAPAAPDGVPSPQPSPPSGARGPEGSVARADVPREDTQAADAPAELRAQERASAARPMDDDLRADRDAPSNNAPATVAPASPPARAARGGGGGGAGRGLEENDEASGRLGFTQTPRAESTGDAYGRGPVVATGERERAEQPAQAQTRAYAPPPPPEAVDSALSRRSAQSAPAPSYAPAPLAAAAQQQGQAQGGLSAAGASGAGANRADNGAFDRGMTKFRSGQYRDAIPELQAAVARPGLTGDALATANLAIARSYRQTGNCGEASRRYEDLMRRFAAYRSNADVNWEAAECYRTLGNTSRANELYRVAERSAQYGERARARRVQMDGARRAAPGFDALDAVEAAPEPSSAGAAAQ